MSQTPHAAAGAQLGQMVLKTRHLRGQIKIYEDAQQFQHLAFVYVFNYRLTMAPIPQLKSRF